MRRLLADALVSSVARQMRFEPALDDGVAKPVAVQQPVSLEYHPACNYRCVVSVSNHDVEIQVYYFEDGSPRLLGPVPASSSRNFTLQLERGGYVTVYAKLDGDWIGRERVLLRRTRAATVYFSAWRD